MYLTGDHLEDLGFEVKYLFADELNTRVGPRWSRFVQPWAAVWRIREAERKWGCFDLIEVHEPLAIGCAVFRKILRSPRIIAFSYGLERRGHDAIVDYRHRKSIPIPIKSRVASRLQGEISLRGVLLSDHVVCSNNEDIAYLRRRGVPAERMTRHFSGVASQWLESDANPLRRAGQGVLFFGTWIERKGIAELVTTYEHVARAYPSVRLTIAGTQVQTSKVLESFSAEVSGRIRIIERLNTEAEIADVLRAHSILVLPSYFEGQPLVMMEAAAFGLALVTTGTCGMLDFVEHERNGLLIPSGDAAACIRAVGRLLDAPELLSSFGLQAFRDVQKYSWRASAENLAAAYGRVASSQAGSRPAKRTAGRERSF
jgi:glycosyltransferase involved in cell wall biosynthesis